MDSVGLLSKPGCFWAEAGRSNVGVWLHVEIENERAQNHMCAAFETRLRPCDACQELVTCLSSFVLVVPQAGSASCMVPPAKFPCASVGRGGTSK